MSKTRRGLESDVYLQAPSTWSTYWLKLSGPTLVQSGMKKMGIVALTVWNSLAELEPSKVETTGLLSIVNCAPLPARV